MMPGQKFKNRMEIFKLLPDAATSARQKLENFHTIFKFLPRHHLTAFISLRFMSPHA